MPARVIARLAVLCVVVLMIMLYGGCSLYPQVAATRGSVSEEQVPGIKAAHSISWGWPEPDWNEFSDVQSRVFMVASADRNSMTKLYVVLGREVRTGQWRVVYASKVIDNRWVHLKISEPPSSIASAATPWVTAH